MKLLPLNGIQNVVQTPAKTMTSRTIHKPVQQTPIVIRTSKMRDFEENLPPNCYFKNEQLSELPGDPVKLIKLKLVKEKTAQNLKNETDLNIETWKSGRDADEFIASFRLEFFFAGSPGVHFWPSTRFDHI